MSTRQEIIAKAIELILNKPQGVRYSELKNKLQSDFPESKAIEQYIWDLDKTHPDEVYKAARGLFRPIKRI